MMLEWEKYFGYDGRVWGVYRGGVERRVVEWEALGKVRETGHGQEVWGKGEGKFKEDGRSEMGAWKIGGREP